MQSFKEYTKRALSISITESISSRLKSALVINETLDTNTPKPVAVDEHSETSKIVTTEEELEAFQIVKAILREKIPAERIAHRDTQSYFGVLLDDNNRKPVCRFHFGTSKSRSNFSTMVKMPEKEFFWNHWKIFTNIVIHCIRHLKII